MFIIWLLEVSIFLIAELLNILILTSQLCVSESISYLIALKKITKYANITITE